MKNFSIFITILAAIISIFIFISGKEHLPEIFNNHNHQEAKISPPDTTSDHPISSRNDQPKNTPDLYISYSPDIYKGKTFTDEFTGIVIGLININTVYSAGYDTSYEAKISLTLPGQNTIYKNSVKPGDVWYFEKLGKNYKIIVIEVCYSNCTFQIKEVDDDIELVNISTFENENSSEIDESPSWKFVGVWQSDVIEWNIPARIIWNIRSNGTSTITFYTQNGTIINNGTWNFSEGLIYEKYGNGGSGRGKVVWINDNVFELTIIDNGIPSYSGVKRVYTRI